MLIALPSRKAADGVATDIAQPIYYGTRERIQKMILEQYEAVLAQMPEEEEQAVAASYSEY